MTTREIIEYSLEMYSGFMNFTDDDEPESKEDKSTLSPLRIDIDHAKGYCRVDIRHLGILLFEAEVQTSGVTKAYLEEMAMKKILNDIIMGGIHRVYDIKQMQPQMKKKEKWMDTAKEVKVGDKFGQIDSLDQANIDGVDYVYFINVRIDGKKKATPFPPGIVKTTINS